MDIKTRMKNAERIGKIIGLMVKCNLPDDQKKEMLDGLNKLEL